MLSISQGQLTLLETCPRKFQHLYLDQLGFPVSPEQQVRLEFGQRFHLLMQQRELGLPIETLAIEEKVQQQVNALVDAAPEVFDPQLSPMRQSEHRRTLDFQGYLLTVVYDLLVLQAHQAQILDWKTYARPQTSKNLTNSWQTRLYLFVLAETSDYEPDQISMTYWFIPPLGQAARGKQTNPQCLRFPYSRQMHQQTQQALTQLLSQLTTNLHRYEAGESLPQVAIGSSHCTDCPFMSRCQRGQLDRTLQPLFSQPELLFDLNQIEEIML